MRNQLLEDTNGRRLRIGILALGKTERLVLSVITANLHGYLNLSADLLPQQRIPPSTLDAGRRQYDAADIIAALDAKIHTGCEKIIAVCARDLFIPIFTYVYGEAQQGGRVALLSTFRLNTDSTGTCAPAVLERTAKVALHECGHLFNLVHCSDRRCLMHFPGNLEQLDRLPMAFCRNCIRAWQAAGVYPWGASTFTRQRRQQSAQRITY